MLLLLLQSWDAVSFRFTPLLRLWGPTQLSACLGQLYLTGIFFFLLQESVVVAIHLKKIQ